MLSKELEITKVCIVRHGQTDWNIQKKYQGREDIDLNEAGKEQAYIVANYLKKSKWDYIITSPLRRAYITADIIRTRIGLKELTTCDYFIERDFGLASGLTREQQKIKFPDDIIPGKEDDEALANRVRKGLDFILQRFQGKNIILVSHGALINALLKVVSDNTINLGETNLKNTCINIIKHIEGKWYVELYNSVEYDCQE